MLTRAQRRRPSSAVRVERLEGRRFFCFDIHGAPELAGPWTDDAAAAARDWRIDAFGGAMAPSVTSADSSTELTIRAEAELQPRAEPVVLRSPADTYVRDGSTYASTNFGNASQLQVKQGAAGWNRESYLRFDLSSLPSAASATLRLFGRLDNTQAASAGFTIFNSANVSWSETGITWNNRLTGGTTVHASGTVTGTTGQWYNLDLSGFVRDELAAGRQVVTLVIRSAAKSPSNIQFDSDEAANPPQLVVLPDDGTQPPPPEPEPEPAESVALRSPADTYVRDGSYAGTNFGNASQLQVKKGNAGWNREAYLRFDLSSAPSSAASATLRLFGRLDNTQAASAGFTVLDSTNTTWSETGTTWNNKLTVGTTVHASGTVSGTAGRWYDIDVSGFVRDQLAAGRQAITLVIRSAAKSPSNIQFDSDEAANPPQLVVSPEGVDDPGGTPVATPGDSFAWFPAASMPVTRMEAQGIAVDGKLYVFGGYINTQLQATRRVDVYNPATNSWQRLADLPEAITHAGIAADGRNIYLAGGVLDSYPGPDTNKVWRYDIDANRFHAVASLPGGRGGGAMVRLGRQLHFFGGADWPSDTGSIIRDFGDHWVLNLDNPDAWVAKATMPNPRNHISGVALGGKVYAIGGQHLSNDLTGNQTSVHRYDPAINSWTSVASLPKALSHTTNSTFVRNGRIVLMAGLTQNSAASASSYQYDPGSDTWAVLPNAPVAAESPVAAYIDGKLIFTGGASDSGGPRAQTYVGVLDNRWTGGTSAPVALGEVAAGIINNKLYLVGEGSSQTFSYNIATGSWTSGLAARPHVGDHHTAEVVNGKLYLFGGFNGSSSGKVQIYNPATNTWSLGASMPFPTGSASSAVIGGKVYVAGGIVNFQPNIGGQTTNQAAVYDPVANTWKSIASMPRGANHAAAATDGQKLYVFGGRDGNGAVLNGFDTVQVYDPATNTWRSSDQSGSNLAPLPRGRGGMGKAVFARGEFYVMGGETKDGGGATADRVYNRVDVYNPASNAWRAAAPMPTPRHGIFPLLSSDGIYVASGGARAGFSQSTALEILDVT